MEYDIFFALGIILGTIITAFVCGWIGSLCGKSRGREKAGFWLGFWLGPIGCVIALFLPALPSAAYSAPHSPAASLRSKICPMCGRRSGLYDTKCPDCGSAV